MSKHSDNYEDAFIFNMFQISKKYKKNNLIMRSFNQADNMKQLSTTNNLVLRFSYYKQNQQKNLYKKFFKEALEQRAIYFIKRIVIDTILETSWLLQGLSYGSNYPNCIDNIVIQTKNEYLEREDVECSKRSRLNHTGVI